MMDLPLKYEIYAKCSTTKARTGLMTLPHATVPLPIFMPVGTAGSMKGISPEQLKEVDCRILLANTYHLSLQPGEALLREVGGLHEFMRWDRAMLTDSGGFQMVSLHDLSEVTEEGVYFNSPYDGTRMLLTPERSIEIQNAIGADIMMQLDDVVSSQLTGSRVEEAMWRSIRWLDRCLAANQRPLQQNLFPILQGGLDPTLRKQCATEMIKRKAAGFAIGGLSGGESKDAFWRIVSLCTDLLPENKPRYCMGVGYAEDLVVCSALGVDMYDCVFPTRTARFGNALTRRGPLYLKKTKYEHAYEPIEKDCPCPTCKTQTRATMFKLLESNEPVACHVLSIHNISFQLSLMRDIRTNIQKDTFPVFVKSFMKTYFHETAEEGFKKRFVGTGEEKEVDEGKLLSSKGYPVWIENALASVGIVLDE